MSTIMSSGLNEYGLRSEFMRRFDATPTLIDELAMRIKSETSIEEYRWLGAVPQVVEWKDGRTVQGLGKETYDIKNLKYEASMAIDREAVDDDQTGQIMIRVNELAMRARVHPDYLLSQLLINGASAGYLAYDNKTFFATDHESGDSGQQSNDLTFDISAELSAEPNTPNRPSVLTLQTGFDESLAALLDLKDDKGEPMAMTDRGLKVICHPSLKIRWLTALQAAFVGSTQNVRDQMGVSVVTMPWLTNKAQWYLAKTDEPTRPFIHQVRDEIEFKLVGPGSEQAFFQDTYTAGVRARYAVSYGRWEFCIRNTFI